MYSSKSSSKKKPTKKKLQKESIRVLVKCSWSGARLSPPTSIPTSSPLLTITRLTTLQDVISTLENQLPPIITNQPLPSSASSADDPQPSIVYMRTNVLKRDWMVTTIGDLLNNDAGCDSIMLTLNLPKERNVGNHATNTNTAAVDVQQQPPTIDSVMTPVIPALAAVPTPQPAINDGIEPMEIDEVGVSDTNVMKAEPNSTEAAHTTTATTATLSSIQAIQNILTSNFDSSSIEYFKTILKILDNILSTSTPVPVPAPVPTALSFTSAAADAAVAVAVATPFKHPNDKNSKLRTLRLSNSTVQKKICNKKHGLDLLLQVIGFSYLLPQSVSSSSTQSNDFVGFDFDRSGVNNESTTSNASTNPISETIVLRPESEDKDKIQSVRKDIVQALTYELNIPMKDIPTLSLSSIVTNNPHHPSMSTKSSSSAASSAASASFDPFKSHSFNIQSAAKGLTDPNSITPEAGKNNEKSVTERQLELLQKQQIELEQKMQSKIIDRNLIAFSPGKTGPIVTLLSGSSHDNSSGAIAGAVASSSGKGDGSLIAMQMKKRQEERKKREEGGFTTKAMRDLEMMKKRKVYSHVQLRIYFPDGCHIEAKFLPNESISIVKQVISSSFLTQYQNQNQNQNQVGQQQIVSELQFDLYVSPPRRILNNSKSLADEGLVPAAKIHVSWKGGTSPPSGKSAVPGSFLQQHLFEVANAQFQMTNAGGSNNASSFPESRPVNQSGSDKKTKTSSTGGKKEGAVEVSNREEEMMKKMMGKKKGLFGKGNTLGRGDSSKNSNGSKGGKPKWFKG